MPELPEVETVMNGLRPALVGQAMKNITVNRRDLRGGIPPEFENVLSGQVIVRLQRRGKYILGFTEGGDGFVLHLGMSGRIRIYESVIKATEQKHDHIIWDMADGARIVFNDPRRFGMLYLVHADTWQDNAPFNRMGPEPLTEAFDGKVLYAALQRRKTAVKTALLNQDVVVGIGNIYACEALYDAGISPFRLSNTLTPSECDVLAQKCRSVLTEAIKSGGSTLKDYAQTDGSLGYFQHRFNVYDREGEPCAGDHCDEVGQSVIKRDVQAGRSTFYCERCQT